MPGQSLAAGHPYGKEYYEHYCGLENYSPDNPELRRFFGQVAQRLREELDPSDVLDAGCAMGVLVDELRRRDVQAYGIDISAYAISQVPPAVRPFCALQSITEPLDRQYDLITCIEVLEHLKPEEGRQAIANLCRHARQILFSSTPHDHAEPTHVNVQPLRHWVKLFAENGFAPVHGYDAGYVSRHALLLRRQNGVAHVGVPTTEKDLEKRVAELQAKVDGLTYRLWIRENEPDETERQRQTTFAYRPLISIVMPTYQADPQLLRAAVDSVLAQTYDNWELIIADGGSSEAVRDLLSHYAAEHDNIQVISLGQNMGISGNTNKAIDGAKGDFIAFFDHDDLLAPFALFSVVEALNSDRNIDFFYSDRDLIDLQGRRFSPFFKPQFSPDTIYSCNYLCQFNVIRANLIREVGGLRPQFDGAQDHDLYLRILERTRQVHHIPRVLYHWRTHSRSASSGGKPGHYAPKLQAVEEALRRRRIPATTISTRWGDVKLTWTQPTAAWNHVIVYPGTCSPAQLAAKIAVLTARTASSRYRVLLPLPEADRAAYAALADDAVEIVTVPAPGGSPYAAFNAAARQISDGNLVFMEHDVEVLSRDWLWELEHWAAMPEIGAVGMKLLAPDGTIRHAGLVLGLTGFAGFVFAGVKEEMGLNPFGSYEWYRNCSGISSACMLVPAAVFHQAGGFVADYAVALGDLDLCLRIRQEGRRILYTPAVQAIHHGEPEHHGDTPAGDLVAFMRRLLPHVLAGDPCFNPNLSLWNPLPTPRLEEEPTLASYFQEIAARLGMQTRV